jgi:acyl carrier protein
MNRLEVEKKIRQILSTYVTDGTVPSDADFKFAAIVGWDSLRHAEFIMRLQREFKVRLRVQEIISIDGFSAAVEAVATRQQS